MAVGLLSRFLNQTVWVDIDACEGGTEGGGSGCKLISHFDVSPLSAVGSTGGLACRIYLKILKNAIDGIWL